MAATSGRPTSAASVSRPHLRFVDVWDAVDQLDSVLGVGAHLEQRFAERGAVT